MVKVSDKQERSKNILRVKRTVPRRPIEDLTFKNQMDNLEPWIKEIYGQAKKTSSPENAISDWSWKTNKEYYQNMIDTNEEINWGQFDRWEGDITIYYPPKKSKFPTLFEEEKRFILLCNTVLGLGLTEEEFLGMSLDDRERLWERIIGV